MRRSIRLIAILLISQTVVGHANGQQQQVHPCERLLQEGLYNHFHITRADTFSEDLRIYLLSEQFKEALHDGKWGASVTIPTEDDAITIGANSSSSDYEVFHNKIKDKRSLSIRRDQYESLVISIPNTDLAKQYVECLAMHPFGFHISTTTTESDATFLVKWAPQFPNDPVPVVQSVEVRGAIEKSVTTKLLPGASLQGEDIVSCLRDPKKDLVLLVQTSRGAVVYKIPAAETEASKDTPVGTVFTSFLNVDQFYEATKANEYSPGRVWTSAKSKWCPADGRVVPGSYYSKLASRDRVPDLRGMFVRGLDIMESVPPQVELDASKRDPDVSRAIGGYQEDQFKSHAHGYTWREPNGQPGGSEAGGRNGLDTKGAGTAAAGGEETRPKNIAVFYYIRIN